MTRTERQGFYGVCLLALMYLFVIVLAFLTVSFGPQASSRDEAAKIVMAIWFLALVLTTFIGVMGERVLKAIDWL